MKNTTFYGNWATFWDGPRADGKINGPATLQPVIGSVDRLIYGYLLFGVKPNPNLKDEGLWPNIGCMYHGVLTDKYYGIPYIPSDDFGTYGMYPNYCFTGMVGNFWIQHDYRAEDAPTFKQLQELRTINPNLEITASYGGWTYTHGGAEFSRYTTALFNEMVSSQANRADFISKSYSYLTANGFDGVDFDWEYPGQDLPGTNNPAYDYYGLEQLIKEYRAYATAQGKPNFVITMQCSGFLSGGINFTNLPGYSEAGISLNMQNDNDYFKWIDRLIAAGLTDVNIMAYDYFTATTVLPDQTGVLTVPNAPLKCGSSSSEVSKSPSLIENTETYLEDINESEIVLVASETPDPNCGKTHTVQKNETATGIGMQYGVGPDELCDYNNLDQAGCYILQEGLTLLIPPKTGTCPSTDSQEITITPASSGLTAELLATYLRIGDGSVDPTPLNELNKGASGWPTLTKGTKYNACGTTYIVKSTDTAASIALAHDTNTYLLCQFNNISSTACNNIKAGTVLNVPVMGWTATCGSAPPKPGPDPNCGKTYTVVSGDSINAIATKFKVSADALCAYNSMPSGCSDIKIGEVLYLPPQKGTCSPVKSQELTIYGVDGVTAEQVANYFKVGNGTPDASVIETMNKNATWPMKTNNPYTVCGSSYTIPAGKGIDDVANAVGWANDPSLLCAFNAVKDCDALNVKNLVVPSQGWTDGCASGPVDPNCGKTYAVASGDSISTIADKFKVSTEALCLYNAFASDCSSVEAGEILLIPPKVGSCPSVPSQQVQIYGIAGKTSDDVAAFFKVGSGAADGSIVEGLNKGQTFPMVASAKYEVCGAQYTVKEGDGIEAIATTLGHGVSSTDLCAYNNLSGDSCTTLTAGKVLSIPAAGWTTSCSSVPPTPPKPPPKPTTIPACISQTIELIQKNVRGSFMDRFVLGLALYGRSFGGVTELAKLAPEDRVQNSMFLNSTGPAPAGSYTRQPGVLSYFEIASFAPQAKPISQDAYLSFSNAYNDMHNDLVKAISTISNGGTFSGLCGQYQSLTPYFKTVLTLLRELDDADVNKDGFAAFNYNASALFQADTFANVKSILSKGGDLVTKVQNIEFALNQALDGYNSLCSNPENCDAGGCSGSKIQCGTDDVKTTMKQWEQIVSGGSTSVTSLPDLVTHFTNFTYGITSSLQYEKEDKDNPKGCQDVYAPVYDTADFNTFKTNFDATVTTIFNGSDLLADGICNVTIQMVGGEIRKNYTDLQTNIDGLMDKIKTMGYTDAFNYVLGLNQSLIKLENDVRTTVYAYLSCCPNSSADKTKEKELDTDACSCPLKDAFATLQTQVTLNPEKAADCSKSYTVKAGDNGPLIQKNNNVSFEQLVECNPDVDFAALSAGEVIKLPTDNRPTTLAFTVQQAIAFLTEIMSLPNKYSATEVSFPCNVGFTTGSNTDFGTAVAYNVPTAQWVSFDNKDTLGDKITAAKQAGFGGVMSFMPQQDDWAAGYPLMNAIAKAAKASQGLRNEPVGYSGSYKPPCETESKGSESEGKQNPDEEGCDCDKS